jgi:hypothetical protein
MKLLSKNTYWLKSSIYQTQSQICSSYGCIQMEGIQVPKKIGFPPPKNKKWIIDEIKTKKINQIISTIYILNN